MKGIFTSYDDLRAHVLQAAHVVETYKVTDSSLLRDELIDNLVYSAQFGPDQVRSDAHQAILKLAQAVGVYPASMQNLYSAIGKEQVSGFTVPAINVRMFTYDFAQTIFDLIHQQHIGPLVFEIAISEQQYTNQPPEAFAASILGAAVKSGYKGPVFLQGDHYQFKADAYKQDPNKELDRLKQHISESIEAGFYNIDIDGSTLVNLDKPNLLDQQKLNSLVTAQLTEYIRSIEPDGVTVSIGGEIGHIGGKNSTLQDFEAFMHGYLVNLDGTDVAGISKVSVQTGTHHGGVVGTDGSLEDIDIDMSVLRSISQAARRTYHMGGAVQHGASTLPDDVFHLFPENDTLEIHLSTGFQNIAYDNLPHHMRERMYEWVRTACASERKDLTDEQFIYTQRKKAWGQFKELLWNMSENEKQPILDNLYTQVAYLCSKLGVRNTRHIMQKYYD